jgi:hypothetical protein
LYEKITYRDSAKTIFDSLRMTHEGNVLVKETKAPTLIQKYEAETIEKRQESESNTCNQF